MKPRVFLGAYAKCLEELLDCVLPDLASFSALLAIATLLFCVFCILFSILDFNILLDHVDRSIFKWTNDIVKGKETWRRVIMTLSGLASFTNALHLVLAAKGRYSTYFWGLIYSVIFGIFSIAYRHGEDAQLQLLINVPLYLIGIWLWRDKFEDRHDVVTVRSLGWRLRLVFFAMAFILGVILYYELEPFAKAVGGTYRFAPMAPRCIDAASHSLSIIAQILLVGRFWEQWIVWVVVDALQVVMYSGEVGTAQNVNILVMFILYLLNSTFGLLLWLKRKQRQERKSRKLDRKSRRNTREDLECIVSTVVSISPSSHKHLPRTSISTTSGPTPSTKPVPPSSLSQSTMASPVGNTGLVIGKFWPVHDGHLYLLDYAQRHCVSLTIIVCERHDRIETPPGLQRQKWLTQRFPQAIVLLKEDKYDQDDSALWAALTKSWLGFVPDVVFTSEDYGEAYCRYLGTRHVCVDQPRRTVPISATMVRQNPFLHWDKIPPFTKAFYAIRICLVGAESTGKTTLAGRLASRFRTGWIGEVGREVTEEKLATEYVWRCEDFVSIGRAQSEREDKAAESCNRLLICDTDAFATTVWHQRYCPNFPVPEELVRHVRERPKKDLYILPSVYNKPFVQDGQRDGEHLREWMFNEFKAKLELEGLPFVVLDGGWDVEFNQAIAAINEVLKAKGWEDGMA
ncbi:hypothetical protein BJ508DRAFT_146159 [Ascobolus immersus RN42]|uniref:NadR/Ttd14 AAA domain-containing protein n=1 Tax=Ascobolus immersus RN42 TaxID=1160509 RepID=A0A3N4IIY5_ASCIM|nr:hypothetical protein BJ508DRAFT_146159 [Ascobolus immersus RN42]